MNEMLEEVSNFDQEIDFILGFAGSGKSTKLAREATDKTLVVVPTHKAAGVLKAKGVENVVTIHATLGLVPTLNQNYDPRKRQRMQKLTKVGGVDLKSIKDIFIDEFSMISQEILDMLLDVLPATTKVTVFGDPYQLPPIEGLAIEPEVYTQAITHLTTQYRAEAPEVVETFMRFMNYIKDGSAMNLKMNPSIQIGTLKNFNPDTDRILAYTNAKVTMLNAQASKILGLPEEFSENESLTANTLEAVYAPHSSPQIVIYPKCLSKGKLMEGEKLLEVVNSVEEGMEKFGTDISMYHQAIVTIDDVSYSMTYDPNHYMTQKTLKANVEQAQAFVYDSNDIPDESQLKEWCRVNKGAKGVRERGQAWSAYIAHSSLVFNLCRPFATTIHKSQGSEFSTVYIAQTDIKKSIRNGYYVTYARLMYVALSRAINRVVIV